MSDDAIVTRFVWDRTAFRSLYNRGRMRYDAIVGIFQAVMR
jgi:hypothetical protein